MKHPNDLAVFFLVTVYLIVATLQTIFLNEFRLFFELTVLTFITGYVYICLDFFTAETSFVNIKAYTLMAFSSSGVTVFAGYYGGAIVEYTESLRFTSVTSHLFIPVYGFLRYSQDRFIPRKTELVFFIAPLSIHYTQQWLYRLIYNEDLYPGVDIRTITGTIKILGGFVVAIVVALGNFIIDNNHLNRIILNIEFY